MSAVVTVPGEKGLAVAFLAEFCISFLLMLTILFVSNAKKLARYTGLFAGLLVATYIIVEAPLSGMSMNPARTFASALFGETQAGLWIYFTAPSLGMLVAAEVYVRLRGSAAVHCAKLHHQNNCRCIFCAYRRTLTRHNEHLAGVEQSAARSSAVPSTP